MISTYCNQFKESVLTSYLSYNLVAFLINKPSLGITNSPTTAQLLERKTLTMEEAAAFEINVAGGYKRAIIPLTPLINNDNERSSFINVSAQFTPTAGSFAACTHICYARGASLATASNANGNNRGDNTGILIKVEPVINAPFIITAPTTFIHNTQFKLIYD